MLKNIEKKELILWHQEQIMVCMKIGLNTYKGKNNDDILDLIKWFGMQSLSLKNDLKLYE